MKVIDYCKKFIELDGDDADRSVEICIQLVTESCELVKTRNAKSDAACLSCIKEQYDKWLRIIEKLNLDKGFSGAFLLTLYEMMPEMKSIREIRRWV